MSKLICFDWAFKTLLRDKANFDILEGFLSELLKENVKILQVLESDTNISPPGGDNYFDFLGENDAHEPLLIELHNIREFDYFYRMLDGTARLVRKHRAQGVDYGDIKKIVGIYIISNHLQLPDFDLTQGEDYLYYGSTSFRGIHRQDTLEVTEGQQKILKYQDVAKIFPEYYLIEVEEFKDVISNKFDEWMYFLKHEEIKSEFSAKGIQEARERLSLIKLDPEAKKAYDDYLESLSHEHSVFKTARQEGRMEGQAEGQLKTLQDMVLTAMQLRFKEVPEFLKSFILTNQEVSVLEELYRQILIVENLEEIKLVQPV